MNQTPDPLAFAQDLIRRPSVTPADEGALGLVQARLEAMGFACRRMRFEEVDNLYARLGGQGPNLCFAGHTDVVPAGDVSAWGHDPFGAEVADGVLYGRGAADMKGAIAAWLAALSRVVGRGEAKGSLSLLITGDEEGPGVNGTKRVVETLAEEGEVIDHCVVGEPTSAAVLGDQIKIGRRGSLNAVVTVEGRQGHVAYPDRAANPIPVLIDLLARLKARRLDDGHQGFQASNLEVTNLEVGNTATNVIPARAAARLNIRFNPAHAGKDLKAWIEAECAAVTAPFRASAAVAIPGEAFLTEPGPFVEVAAGAVRAVLGREPALSTTGGSSDARFIRALCPVIELGLVGATMHMVDEHAPVADIEALAAVYERLIEGYFARFT
jgi:succinyl-diaminopimelate desuccinylase